MKLSLIQLFPVETPITSKSPLAATPSCAARFSMRAVAARLYVPKALLRSFYESRLTIGLHSEDAARDVGQEIVLGVCWGRSPRVF